MNTQAITLNGIRESLLVVAFLLAHLLALLILYPLIIVDVAAVKSLFQHSFAASFHNITLIILGMVYPFMHVVFQVKSFRYFLQNKKITKDALIFVILPLALSFAIFMNFAYARYFCVAKGLTA